MGDEVSDVQVEPATADRWDDLERLAGERGFRSDCWCMWWRLPGREFGERSRLDRRAALESLARSGVAPGLVAYVDGEPAGWVALAPRTDYPRLSRSTKLNPIDDELVWSISCFYIHRRHRRRGVAKALLDAAVDHARSHGAQLVEGYPIDTATSSRSSTNLYTGTLAMFEQAGFVEITRRGDRPIVRFPASGSQSR